ncbi:BBE domain-containing protein, partial [Actinoplanes sp. NPDC051633]|uniref:BBE domain-containing protein n=1 Tax=Actinoplanes sp. NPDC051633 TaxID=3155670 RepID=UPI00342E6ACE
ETSLLLPELGDVAAKSLLEVAGPGSGSPWSSVQIRHLGGALRRPGRGAGATGAIDEEFSFMAIGVPVPSMAEALAAHRAVLTAAMAPHASARKLFNFLSPGEPAALAFDAATVDRLRAVKAARDPRGVFRSNRPI